MIALRNLSRSPGNAASSLSPIAIRAAPAARGVRGRLLNVFGRRARPVPVVRGEPETGRIGACALARGNVRELAS